MAKKKAKKKGLVAPKPVDPKDVWLDSLNSADVGFLKARTLIEATIHAVLVDVASTGPTWGQQCSLRELCNAGLEISTGIAKMRTVVRGLNNLEVISGPNKPARRTRAEGLRDAKKGK